MALVRNYFAVSLVQIRIERKLFGEKYTIIECLPDNNLHYISNIADVGGFLLHNTILLF